MNNGPHFRILQINVEGMSEDKFEYLTKIANENDIDIIALQETHIQDECLIAAKHSIHGYRVVATIPSRTHGSTIYVKESIQ